MPIRSFLRRHDFDPETVAAMSRAFQSACRKLGLADRNDPLNEIIAGYVIELASTGARNPSVIYMLTVRHFQGHQSKAA